MEPYSNLSGISGVLAYQPGGDHITVQFRAGQYTYYKYTNSSAGSAVIEMLKSLARQGRGLNSYISTHKPGYSSKASSLAGLY
jgi:hypothetical protein